MSSRPDLRFGVFPDPGVAAAEQTVALAERADRLGLDVIGIQDHPYQRRHLDAYALLTWIAARTERIRLFSDVTNLPLRPPAVLAQHAASIDVLSGGRFELGLGAGGFWDAIEAIGGPRRPPGEAYDAFKEAIDVIRAMWSGDRSVRVEGQHYGVAGVRPGPTPAHDMEIWVGASGPRMLKLTGERADGWVGSSSYVPPEQLAAFHAHIDAGAEAAGRKPSAIRRIYNVSGAIVDNRRDEWNGPHDQWVELIGDLVETHRMDTFLLWPEGDPVEQIERWAAVAGDLRRLSTGG